MAIMKVTSGEVRSGVTLDSSLSMEIYSYGTAEDTKVRSAGVMAVLDKGSAVRTSVFSSGSAVIFDGGYMNAATLLSGKSFGV